MKTLLNILKLTACFAVAGVGFFAASALSAQFSISGASKTALDVIGVLPGVILYALLDGSVRANVRSMIRPVPKVVWLWRIAALLIALFGVFLGIGNRSGSFPTFPYAGSLVIFVGAVIFGLKGVHPTDAHRVAKGE